MKSHQWIAIAGVFGAFGIAVGAFGAHGLPVYLAEAGFDEVAIAERLATFETGARYHLYSALALLAVGIAKDCWPGAGWSVAGWLLLAGGLIFSHLLYALAILAGARWLGAVVPIGGVGMISGWLALAMAATRHRNQRKTPRT